MLSKLKSRSFFLLTVVFSFVLSPFAFADTASNTNNVAGYWQTFDGKTKLPSSIIHVYQDGQFYVGKVVKGYTQPSEVTHTHCVACKGSKRNKPIIGMIIIKNMMCQNGMCRGGTILDPRNGDIYRAKMQVVDNGAWMKVRGFLGVALFGKTVVWKRVTQKDVK